MVFKECIVKNCRNNNIKTPIKIFLCVPQNPEVRLKWLAAVESKVKNKNVYICEDHFNLQFQAENWMYYLKFGGSLRMKPNILPQKNPIGPTSSTSTQAILDVETVKAEEENEMEGECKYNLENINSEESQIVCENVVKQTTTKNKAIQVYANQFKRNKKTMTDFGKWTVKSTQTENILNYDDSSSDDNENIPLIRLLLKSSTKKHIESNSKFYLGIPQNTYFIVKTIENKSPAKLIDILITLKKIRLNDSYERISNDFQVDLEYVISCVKKTLPVLAEFLTEFTTSRCKQQNIIDCFEVEIEKPTNVEKQILTWSKYKKKYTVKYLISCSRKGFINYISRGFGGSISDKLIFKIYSDGLSQNFSICVDRGFKHIPNILSKVKRIDSSKKNEFFVQDEFTSLEKLFEAREELDKIVDRLREFTILSEKIDLTLIDYLDFIVVIVVSLINLTDE